MTGTTLGLYLARDFLRNTAGLFFLFFFLIMLVDIIELSRQVSAVTHVRFSDVALVCLFRAPSFAENILPFAVMFGASASLIMLNRKLELVVARASGVSVWQFLMPLVVTAALIGLFASLAYNPLSLRGLVLSKAKEAGFYGDNGFKGSSKDAWMRLNQTGGDVVIRARVAQKGGTELNGVTAYRYSSGSELIERLDAKSAQFVEGPSGENHFLLHEVVSSIPGQLSRPADSVVLPVKISRARLQIDQTNADNVGFWQLGEQAEKAQLAGNNFLPFLTRYQSLLSQPLLFVAMVLLAATVSLRFARFGLSGKAILAGVLAGFMLYVLSKLLITFGSNGLVPPFVAAWTPAIVASLIGVTVLLHQEDG